MVVMFPVCCGIDVHKRFLTVCLVTRDAEGNRQETVRTFKTVTRELKALREYLREHSCPVVAMESTGTYWRPLYKLLEREFEVLLVNPTHYHNVPGRSTDVSSCVWIAQLLEYGLLKGSFIPPAWTRELRDLTRYRRRLVEAHTDEVNRVHKVLEDAGIKLASVATDIMGVSGREMMAALVAGERDPEVLAELSRGRLRSKKKELELALEGGFSSHHAFMLSQLLSHLEELEQRIAELESKIDESLAPYAEVIELLMTIPGVHKRTAQDILAEIGVDMARFPTHKHLCSWAGMCPGNNESGGKRKSGRTRKGNSWLKSTLTESGHAAGRTKDTYLGDRYHRLSARRGKKRAAIAIGHDQLAGAYFIIRDHVPWQELGHDYLDRVNQDRLIRHHANRLRDLGLDLDLNELLAAAQRSDPVPAPAA